MVRNVRNAQGCRVSRTAVVMGSLVLLGATEVARAQCDGGETAKLTADDGAAEDYFGWSVFLSGDKALIGAHLDDDNGSAGGSAYVFCGLLPCDGDANCDGVVDPLDAGFVLARFGCSFPEDGVNCLNADANGDGQVDPLDMGYVLARFGPCD